ncbi:MAG: hypothetical protein HRT82_15470 [Henriciella sp.]|nr:hypothetical protein [Henriciella sp.]
MRVDGDLIAQMGGKGVLTTEILYYRPDYRSWLQSFVWQTMDEAPRFPRLAQFLDHWRREIDAVIHSSRIAHADWVGPTEIRPVDGEFHLI